MDNLQKIQNGDYGALRSNDVARWVGNDVIRKGNQYASYDMLPRADGPSNFDKNFVKLPQATQDNLKRDAYNLAKLKHEAAGIDAQRMYTPDIAKEHMKQKARLVMN